MKKVISTLAVFSSVAAMAMPQISTEEGSAVKASVSSYSGDVRVKFQLAGEPAVDTAVIRVSGEVIPGATFAEPSGDLNCLVLPGSRVGRLKALGNWPGRSAAPEIITVELKAWPTNGPPDFMSVNLTTGDRRYYASTNELPYGLESDVWRSTHCLMKLIPAAGETFRMGSPTNETDRTVVREVAHNVTFTKDFYIGVFEVTRGQYTNVVASLPASSKGDGFDCPVNHVRFDAITADGGFLDVLSTRSGVDFGLPTDAQWEFACRAGSRTAYNNGTDGGLGDLAWYNGNSGYASGLVTTKRVGTKSPNAFGLYDMHGNLYELCRDWYSEGATYSDGSCVTDPTGPTSGSTIVYRGGSFGAGAAQCRSAFRAGGATSGNAHFGFRLCCPAVVK